jgi:hypothetical protein
MELHAGRPKRSVVGNALQGGFPELHVCGVTLEILKQEYASICLFVLDD